ncbi:DEAD/DEAH box helicase [Lyngbya confervoides]|uniref:RNA helicase n=1 Tax=Lyngbya confervoides BDU141951 TaxID=1574623 RepID=A0ABD4T7Y4_9CYAN|nr:DEAD/DEAH box helicase [Lyngbya confervoides]MCM1984736.1 DEAD/DEAH box helicase [Lyngbya confervoides BDU141951]
MTLSFEQLGLSAQRVACLKSLGFEAPTPIQSQAIPIFLEGRDLIGQAQTGTGKTAAFSLPILERVNPDLKVVQALILTPTRELAMQVSQAMQSFKADAALRVLAVYGGQAIDPQIAQLKRGVHIVVGTPGRVLDLLERQVLKLDHVNCFVLDEADEMLNMGFIPDVTTILNQVPETRQAAFFSATMSPAIFRLAKQFLDNPVNIKVEMPQATPNRIRQIGYAVPRRWSRPAVLQAVLELEDPTSAIIFVQTRREAADLTQRLQSAGYSADEYHGDLSQHQRERLLHRFKQGSVRWVVATDIAARGIHVDELSHVINYTVPDQHETYVHRIGRTGRAGSCGTAISLVHPTERYQLRGIGHHVNQEIQMLPAPTRAQIEARRFEHLTTQIQDVLQGERLASFLPLVSELSEEYDTRAIAAAALQLAFDQYPPIGNQLDAIYQGKSRSRATSARSERSRKSLSTKGV